MAEVLRDARLHQDIRESELEERVSERTIELAATANTLRAEVEIRKKAEQALQLACEFPEMGAPYKYA